eukprot:TRINITY_DN23781_c0_g1_i1.p1 TRINITY_DN23781_c0_g1~~TRINITY_DN23781_c0_g1_i1.p1  ORF type:complete len:716 (+),score=154.25 TRINITY_DN23781_c0_g1_i1:136-2283(+)
MAVELEEPEEAAAARDVVPSGFRDNHLYAVQCTWVSSQGDHGCAAPNGQKHVHSPNGSFAKAPPVQPDSGLLDELTAWFENAMAPELKALDQKLSKLLANQEQTAKRNTLTVVSGAMETQRRSTTGGRLSIRGQSAPTSPKPADGQEPKSPPPPSGSPQPKPEPPVDGVQPPPLLLAGAEALGVAPWCQQVARLNTLAEPADDVEMQVEFTTRGVSITPPLMDTGSEGGGSVGPILTGEITNIPTVKTLLQKSTKELGRISRSEMAQKAKHLLENKTRTMTSNKEHDFQKRDTRVGKVRRSIFTFLDDPDSSLAANIYASGSQAVVCMSVMLAWMQTSKTQYLHGIPAAIFETTMDAFFIVENLVRFWSAKDKISYFKDKFNILDFMVSWALIPRALAGFVLDDASFANRTLLLCVVPTLRMAKTLRHFQKIHLIVHAFVNAFEALPVLLWALVVLVLVFSTGLWIAEPETFEYSYPTAMWMTLVTLSTVGYGDIHPETNSGYMITSVLIVSSALYMAMPLGIVGNAFHDAWTNRHQILLVMQTRRKLQQWGYCAEDIQHIFEIFDNNGSGEIELPEFLVMMTEMRVGISQERCVHLFEIIDTNSGGSIDHREFVRYIFPSEYVAMYEEAERILELEPPEAIVDRKSWSSAVANARRMSDIKDKKAPRMSMAACKMIKRLGKDEGQPLVPWDSDSEDDSDDEPGMTGVVPRCNTR